MADIGEPIRKFTVVPLDNPVQAPDYSPSREPGATPTKPIPHEAPSKTPELEPAR